MATRSDTQQRTFTIITTAPNELIAPIHDRIPVIVQSDQADDWLFQGNPPAAVMPLLEAPPNDYLVATAVSPRINSVRNDDPGCLEPVPYAAKDSRCWPQGGDRHLRRDSHLEEPRDDAGAVLLPSQSF